MQPWYTRSIEATAEELQSSTARGLSPEEAAARLQQHGPNELTEQQPPTFLQRLWGQLNDFLVLILIAAAAISMLLGEFVDGGVIIAIVILNAILGLVQESKAEQALAALRQMTKPTSRVIRGGQAMEVPSRELVPGDLVLLEAGDNIPADLRLIEAATLKVEEASLTGESVPVDKDAQAILDADTPLGDRSNLAFMGTAVSYGRGKGLVVATGMQTEIGHIAGKLQSYEEEPTRLQIKLGELGRKLGLLTLIVCGIVFALGWYQGKDWLSMLMTAISLAVAAIPEGLPAVVTIVLALGTTRMVRRKAIIRKLSAVETLGSTTVICSDKTGTLTQNEMTVTRLFANGTFYEVSGEGYKPVGQFRQMESLEQIDAAADPVLRRLLIGGTLCSDAKLTSDDGILGDPTEGALVVAAAKAYLEKETLEGQLPRVAELPFDSDRKLMTTFHRQGNSLIAFVKGAPDVLLARCTRIRLAEGVVPLTDELRAQVLEANKQMADQALRVLAVAERSFDALPDQPTSENTEQDLTLIGLTGMIDPPRPEAITAVKTAKQAGIRTVMITGDHLDTAYAIARQMGITTSKEKARTGAALEGLSDSELEQLVREVDVYARVSPEHKVWIVEALRRQGEVVAMTGDGVNDALALKRSDIGVAMGITGTGVAKGTADMILADDNFATIVGAVEEGRVIYANIRKFVYFLLSCNVGEIAIIFIAMLLGWPIPLAPVHLLWLNLVTDSFPALALGMEPAEPGIMNQKPRNPEEPILNRSMTIGIAVQSLGLVIAVLGAFGYGYLGNHGIIYAQTMAFATLIMAELWRSHTARSETHSLGEIGWFSNRYIWLATLAGLLLMAFVLFTPFMRQLFRLDVLRAVDWLIVVGLSFVPALLAEGFERFYQRLTERRV